MAKILIIEDSPDLQEMYQIIFKLRNIESNVVSTKQDMMQQLVLNRPDVLLLDVMLRTEDGRDMCKELKQHEDFKDIPIILISASPDKLKDYEQCLADDVIEKPFGIDVLIGKINSLIKQEQF